MNVKVNVVSPDGDAYSIVIEDLPIDLTVQQLHWLVYGRIVDRNIGAPAGPLGFDPNECQIEVITEMWP